MTLPLLIPITQECFTVKSHNTNLGAVAHGALELYVSQFSRRYFFSDPSVQKYLHRRKGKKVMTATNICSNFGGMWDSLP